MGSPAIVSAPSACADLIPTDWAEGVAHEDLPAPAPARPADKDGVIAWTLDELKKWTGFGVGEANRLDQANGRTRDAVGIVRRCEERDARAVEKARPKFLGVF